MSHEEKRPWATLPRHRISKTRSNSNGQSSTPADAVRDKVQDIADKVNVVGNFVNDVDAQIAYATDAISALLPAMPAAFLLSPALGVPHAHYLHPPSGPPPLPPIPLPPFGPVLLGTCVQVLINKLPAARCGDIGINPTCCGLPPMFEIFTGSSKVFIGGTRAARAFMDITMHCTPVPPEEREAEMAAKVVSKASVFAKIGKAVSKAAEAAEKGLNVANQVGMVAGMAAQATAIVADAEDAEADDDPAMSAADNLAAGMTAAQLAADAVAMAMAMAMGKDPLIPPTGTPGVLLMGSPNVMIGGLPLPNSLSIVQGLLKRLKGKRYRTNEEGRSEVGGCDCK